MGSSESSMWDEIKETELQGKGNLYKEQEDLLNRAKKLAYEYHAKQVDKAGQPYILHLYRVSSSVCCFESKVIAWLHDIVEDTDMTLDTLSEYFPLGIVCSVDAITKREVQLPHAQGMGIVSSLH